MKGLTWPLGRDWTWTRRTPPSWAKGGARPRASRPRPVRPRFGLFADEAGASAYVRCVRCVRSPGDALCRARQAFAAPREHRNHSRCALRDGKSQRNNGFHVDRGGYRGAIGESDSVRSNGSAEMSEFRLGDKVRVADETGNVGDQWARGREAVRGATRVPRSRDTGCSMIEWTAQAAVPSRVNSAACSLTKSYMLIGFWPVSLNTSSVRALPTAHGRPGAPDQAPVRAPMPAAG
jgi:hypothetical protein